MKIAVLIAIILLLTGCATSPNFNSSSNTCIDNDFVTQSIPSECMKEVCIHGKIVRTEEISQTALTEDWAEERFCLLHPFNCYEAYEIKQTSKWDQKIADSGKYWDRKSLYNGLGDAARHAFLMCIFTEKFGVDFARGLGIAHEQDSGYLMFSRKGGAGNACCEKVMDLFNNEIGIMLANKPGTCEEKVLDSLHLLRYSLCTEKKDDTESTSNSSTKYKNSSPP